MARPTHTRPHTPEKLAGKSNYRLLLHTPPSAGAQEQLTCRRPGEGHLLLLLWKLTNTQPDCLLAASIPQVQKQPRGVPFGTYRFPVLLLRLPCASAACDGAGELWLLANRPYLSGGRVPDAASAQCLVPAAFPWLFLREHTWMLSPLSVCSLTFGTVKIEDTAGGRHQSDV